MRVTGGHKQFKIFFSRRPISEDRKQVIEYLKDKSQTKALSPLAIATDVLHDRSKRSMVTNVLKELGYPILSPHAARMLNRKKPTLLEILQDYLTSQKIDISQKLSPKRIAKALNLNHEDIGRPLKKLGYTLMTSTESLLSNPFKKSTLIDQVKTYLKDKDPTKPLSPIKISIELFGNPSKRGSIYSILKVLGYKSMTQSESRLSNPIRKSTLTDQVKIYLKDKDPTKPLSPMEIALELFGDPHKHGFVARVLQKQGYQSMSSAESKLLNPTKKPTLTGKIKTYLKGKDRTKPLSPTQIAIELFGNPHRNDLVVRVLKGQGYQSMSNGESQVLRQGGKRGKVKLCSMVNRETGKIIDIEDSKALTEIQIQLKEQEAKDFSAYLKSQGLDEMQLFEVIWDALDYLKNLNFKAYTAVCHQLDIYDEAEPLPPLAPTDQKKFYKEGIAYLKAWLLQEL